MKRLSSSFRFASSRAHESSSTDSLSPEETSEDALILQDTDDDNSSSFQLPTSMFRPLYRTDSILKRKPQSGSNRLSSVLTSAPEGSSSRETLDGAVSSPEYAFHNESMELGETSPPTSPLNGSSSSIKPQKKSVKFASHVQVQHTPTQYQRTGLPPPYHINFWRRNRIAHIAASCVATIVVLIEAAVLAIFWRQSCTKPLQYITLGDVGASGVILLCIISYTCLRFLMYRIERRRRRLLQQKTLQQLKRLKKKRQKEYGFENTPTTPTLDGSDCAMSLDDGVVNSINVLGAHSSSFSHTTSGTQHADRCSNASSTVDERQIHLQTSFRKEQTASIADDAFSNGKGLMDMGATQVESDDEDYSDASSSRASTPVQEPIQSSPLLISSLRTKVVEASIDEEDEDSPDQDNVNPSDENNEPHQMDTSQAQTIEESHATEQTASHPAPLIESQQEPTEAPQASVSTIPPIRSKFRANKKRSLKHRKFRDSIVLNKKQLKQKFDMEQELPGVSSFTPQVRIPVITQVQISENPTQDYKILSRSIREVERGTLMLEPLADTQKRVIVGDTQSLHPILLQFLRRHLFSVIFFLVWSLAHLWGIVSLVFIIDYGDCPSSSSVLYFLNVVFFACIVILSGLEFCILVLSYK